MPNEQEFKNQVKDLLKEHGANVLELEGEQDYQKVDDPEAIQKCKEYNECLKAVEKYKAIKKYLEARFMGRKIEVEGICKIDFETKLVMDYKAIE